MSSVSNLLQSSLDLDDFPQAIWGKSEDKWVPEICAEMPNMDVSQMP